MFLAVYSSWTSILKTSANWFVLAFLRLQVQDEALEADSIKSK